MNKRFVKYIDTIVKQFIITYNKFKSKRFIISELSFSIVDIYALGKNYKQYSYKVTLKGTALTIDKLESYSKETNPGKNISHEVEN